MNLSGTHVTGDAGETRKLGARFARALRRGDTVAFFGDLGSGKTTMIQGIVSRLTGKTATSPSFVLVKEYDGPTPVFHFDFYRFTNIREIETLGWDEYAEKGIVLVEWAQRVQAVLPPLAMRVSFSITGENRRAIEIEIPGGTVLQ